MLTQSGLADQTLPSHRIISVALVSLTLGLFGLCVPATADEGLRRIEIEFDGGVPSESGLAVDLQRGSRIWDPLNGEVLGPDQPAFDLRRAGGLIGPWRPVDTPLVVASVVAAGWSRDQTERRTAIYDRSLGRLLVWHGPRVRGEPDAEIDCRRQFDAGIVFDALVGSSFERTDVVHRISSATMLPGCLLALLERTRVGEGGELLGVDGVSVAALQESEAGDWEWSWIAAMPDPLVPEARDFSRGSLSSMASYYPTTRESGFLEAFVPLVDYVNHRADSRAPGGQCGIFRAVRSRVGAAWTFGPLVEIARSWGTVGEHFHVAGWTPNGVVLAVGDSELSRVSLLRCSDWSEYEVMTNWTETPRWQGDLPDGRLVSCNQFWSCCAGNDDRHLLVGGDNVTGSVFSLDVSEKGSEPPRFTRLFGDQGSRLADGETANTVSWMVRERPEIEGPITARQVLDGVSSPQYSRVLQSLDGESFAAVARVPTDVDRLAVPFPAGDEIGLLRFNAAGPRELHVAGPVLELPELGGLLLRPGGFDLLRDESGQHRAPDDVFPSAVVDVERIDPEVASALSDRVVPADAVCYRVSGTTADSATRLLTASFIDPRTDEEMDDGQVAVTAHAEVCNLLSSKLRLRLELTRGFGVTDKTVTIASQGDWHDVDIWSFRTSLSADVQVRLDNRSGGDTGTVDFLLIFRSIVIGRSAPGWQVDPAPRRMVSGDQLDVRLPIRTDMWRLGVEFMIPPDGIDFSCASNVPESPLFTLLDGRGGRLTAVMKPSGGEIRFLAGESATMVGRITSLHANRGDLVRIDLDHFGASIRASARVAGETDPSASSVEFHAQPPRPTKLRIGGPDHELVSSLILRRVVVETPEVPSGPIAPQELGPEYANARRGHGRSERPVAEDLVFRIASRLGTKVSREEREIDLDGDGLVTLLDLQMGVRIAGRLSPTGPPARGR